MYEFQKYSSLYIYKNNDATYPAHFHTHCEIMYVLDGEVNVTVDGPAEIIGPDEFSLIGGVRAFWVRTVGKSGDVKVRIKTESQPEQIVELKVIKK